MYKKYFLIVTLVLFTTLIIFFTLISSIQDNTQKSNWPGICKVINAIAPQGWAFFSKSPLELKFRIFKVNNLKKNAFELVNIKNVQENTYYGLNKSNRILPHFLQKVIANIDKNAFYPIKDFNINTCPLDSLNSFCYNIKEENVAVEEGDYIIECYQELPYLYYIHDINQKLSNLIKVRIIYE